MADSTRAMRRSIFERELLPVWRNRLLTEISPDDLRAHCASIVDRGAPATAIHVRDILKQIYRFAILHGEKVANPADEVGPASIATFVPKDRSLSPSEIRVRFKVIEKVPTLPTIRLGMWFFLLSMVRKSELQDSEGSDRCGEPGSGSDADGGRPQAWDQHRSALYLARATPERADRAGHARGAAVCRSRTYTCTFSGRGC